MTLTEVLEELKESKCEIPLNDRLASIVFFLVYVCEAAHRNTVPARVRPIPINI